MMSSLRTALAALTVVSLVFGATVACRRIEESARPAVGARFGVLYSTNVDGDIEPCG